MALQVLYSTLETWNTAASPEKPISRIDPKMSIIHGVSTPKLYEGTIAQLLHDQAQKYQQKEAVVVPWQNTRLSFADLEARSGVVASSLIHHGVATGDVVAIMAGNRFEYIEAFLGASRIGVSVAVLNNTYTPAELMNALQRISSKAFFVAGKIGARDMRQHIDIVEKNMGKTDGLPALNHLVTFDPAPSQKAVTYQNFVQISGNVNVEAAEERVSANDMVNLQFTSGTTGSPKAAMLTHRNIINNGALVGSRMHLGQRDVVCCPPPLFHCFGLVMGFLCSLFHGSTIVFAADTFDPVATLDAMVQEQCTAILGVPTMFLAELDALAVSKYRKEDFHIRTGLAAGSVVPPPLLKRLREEMGFSGILNAYGMTETSPVSFMMSLDDPPHRLQRGLGKVMPHTSGKIVDKDGKVVPRGVRGELWTSGYCVMKGYYANVKGTQDVFAIDEADSGRVWMKTGDECVIDEEGFCEITGRIKDIIIRGGENIFPSEIEEVLIQHSSIAEASVVGIPDERYGEVVGCFLKEASGRQRERPNAEEVREWVRSSLGRQKSPKWVFWIGEPGVGDDYPKTGSGKHQKHILKAIGDRLVKDKVKAKL